MLFSFEAGFLEQLSQFPEALIPLHRGRERAILADDHVSGKSADLIRPRHFIFRGQHNGIAVRMLLQKLFNDTPLLTDRDANDHEFLTAIFTIKLLDGRTIGAAWPAPGGPEIEQNGLALEIRQCERF